MAGWANRGRLAMDTYNACFKSKCSGRFCTPGKRANSTTMRFYRVHYKQLQKSTVRTTLRSIFFLFGANRLWVVGGDTKDQNVCAFLWCFCWFPKQSRVSLKNGRGRIHVSPDASSLLLINIDQAVVVDRRHAMILLLTHKVQGFLETGLQYVQLTLIESVLDDFHIMLSPS